MKGKHNKFVVFLDIDGVLNTRHTVESTPKGCIGIDDTRVTILANAIKKYGGADIVLTSDWKDLGEDDEDYLYLISKLSKEGLTISGKIRDEENPRGFGVWEYLREHPEIEEYVILDDNTFDFRDFRKLWERLIITYGIENPIFASRVPTVETIIFMDYLKVSK